MVPCCRHKVANTASTQEQAAVTTAAAKPVDEAGVVAAYAQRIHDARTSLLAALGLKSDRVSQSLVIKTAEQRWPPTPPTPPAPSTGGSEANAASAMDTTATTGGSYDNLCVRPPPTALPVIDHCTLHPLHG